METLAKNKIVGLIVTMAVAFMRRRSAVPVAK